MHAMPNRGRCLGPGEGDRPYRRDTMPLTFTRRAAAAGLLTGIVAVGTGIGPATAQSRSAATESKSAAAQHAEIDRLIKVVDRSGSGKISFDDARQFVLERFDKLDSDKDGTLTLQELQAPMRERIR